MLKMSCARRGLPAAGQFLIWGQSYGVTAFLLVCLAQTGFEVDKGSVLGRLNSSPRRFDSTVDTPILELFSCS